MGVAESGFGTTIAGAVTTALGELMTIGMPSLSVDVIDTTFMASPDGAREKIAGLIDSGDLNVTARYAESASPPIYSDAAGANEVWTITFPAGGTLTFSGFISGVNGSSTMDDKIEWDFTITVSGLVVFAAGA